MRRGDTLTAPGGVCCHCLQLNVHRAQQAPEVDTAWLYYLMHLERPCRGCAGQHHEADLGLPGRVRCQRTGDGVPYAAGLGGFEICSRGGDEAIQGLAFFQESLCLEVIKFRSRQSRLPSR